MTENDQPSAADKVTPSRTFAKSIFFLSLVYQYFFVPKLTMWPILRFLGQN